MTRPSPRRARRALGRPVALLLALALTAGLAAAPAAGAPTPSPSDGDTSEEEVPEVPLDPLTVDIDGLAPSTLPARGPVTVTGRVRNRSTTVWEGLTVYLVVSSTPLTTAEEVAAAVASDPRTDVGDRIVEAGLYVDVPDLDPGESTRFRLAVPRGRLPVSGEPGVYWLAVHVLGETEGARLEGADGRARTFLPLVPRSTEPVPVALALQVRKATRRAADGSLESAADWRRVLARDGRLGRVLGLGASAGRWPLAWVLDPAVADSARSMARSDPPLGLDPEEPDPEPARGSRRAQAWLDQLTATLGQAPVLALPYADVDVSALVRQRADGLMQRARDAAGEVLDELGISGTPVLADPSGYLAPAALEATDPGVPVLLAPAAVAGGPDDEGGDEGDAPLGAAAAGPVVERARGGPVLVTPSPADLEGPGPSGTRSALGVRQRLLADAAVQALSGDPGTPLLRVLPALWDPGPRWRRARFFAGLDVGFVEPVGLGGLLAGGGPALEDPAYPLEAVRAELPPALGRAAQQLVSAGAVLDEVLTENDIVAGRVSRQALTSVSVWDRGRGGPALERAVEATATVEAWLDAIEVRGPSFVTMSSESGTLPVTVVNGLDQTVTVDLRVSVAGDALRLEGPGELSLPPRSRRALQLAATARDIGVHSVTLQPVTTAGTSVGDPATLSIRTSRVGFILWVVMAVGGGILLVAVVVRIVRRIRRRRRTHGPLLAAGTRR